MAASEQLNLKTGFFVRRHHYEITEDPFHVLGVARAAGDQEIRRAYLKLVREHPPEREPETFARIQAAYHRIKSPEERAHALVLTPHAPEGNDVTALAVGSDPKLAGIPLAVWLAHDPFSDLPIASDRNDDADDVS